MQTDGEKFAFGIKGLGGSASGEVLTGLRRVFELVSKGRMGTIHPLVQERPFQTILLKLRLGLSFPLTFDLSVN